MKKEYADLIEEFSKLDKDIKHYEIKDELQEILALFYKLCKKKYSKDILLVHEKMKKIDDKNLSDEEFMDGVYAYLISIKELIGKYFY